MNYTTGCGVVKTSCWALIERQPVCAEEWSDELTSSPEDIAMKYATEFSYKKGMPGPSYTWSAFAPSVSQAISILRSGRVLPMVTERLDESLISARHFLGNFLFLLLP